MFNTGGSVNLEGRSLEICDKGARQVGGGGRGLPAHFASRLLMINVVTQNGTRSGLKDRTISIR